MTISPLAAPTSLDPASMTGASAKSPQSAAPETSDAFNDFVGNTFFSQMMKALRSTQSDVAYLGGSQGEKTFQSQLDQHIAGQLAETHGAQLARPMQGAFARSIDVRV